MAWPRGCLKSVEFAVVVAMSKVPHFDAILGPSSGPEYSKLSATEDADHAAPKPAPGHVRITRFAKIVFGWGFAAENMFDVAGDTLLTKFYAGSLHSPRLGRGAGLGNVPTHALLQFLKYVVVLSAIRRETSIFPCVDVFLCSLHHLPTRQ